MTRGCRGRVRLLRTLELALAIGLWASYVGGIEAIRGMLDRGEGLPPPS